MYKHGEGVEQSDANTFRWHQQAAVQGHAAAQASVGSMYDQGKGVAQNYSKALEWYRLAAERGHPPSQVYIGDMYAAGLGVPQNNILAYMWYHISIANGSIDGSRGRKRVADRMTAEDISAAQAAARSCVESDYEMCQ